MCRVWGYGHDHETPSLFSVQLHIEQWPPSSCLAMGSDVREEGRDPAAENAWPSKPGIVEPSVLICPITQTMRLGQNTRNPVGFKGARF